MSEWHFVPGYPDHEIELFTHQVRHRESCVYRNLINSDGYWRVSLKNKTGQRPVKIATILGLILFGPSEVVRHLNDDRSDDRLCNLAPGTHRDNVEDAMRNGKNPGRSHKNCDHNKTAKARLHCNRHHQGMI